MRYTPGSLPPLVSSGPSVTSCTRWPLRNNTSVVPGGALTDACSNTSPSIARRSPICAVLDPLVAENVRLPGVASASITE